VQNNCNRLLQYVKPCQILGTNKCNYRRLCHFVGKVLLMRQNVCYDDKNSVCKYDMGGGLFSDPQDKRINQTRGLKT